MKTLLEIKDITVEYDVGVPAIEGINFSLSHREIIGIVGESGSGKTTLIRALINLLHSRAELTAGSINFKGRDLSSLSRAQWRQLRGNEISMIFQNPGSYLNPVIRVGTQFIESIRNHRTLTVKAARQKALDTLEKMNLKDPDRIMKAYPFQLSGGMKQRVAIAMAMAMEPALILADEPTSALDVKTQAQIVRELVALRDRFDTSIILVTHNICCSAQMADRIMVMYRGRALECGHTAEILTRPRDAYTRQLLGAIPSLKGKRDCAFRSAVPA